jgi:predicted nucleic acid-binding Zn ribbon protein
MSWEKVMSRCAWCGSTIPSDSEIFGLGVKAKPGIQVEEGSVMEVLLFSANKTVLGIVPMNDSQAKREGKDLLFMICSESCGAALKKELQKQIELIESIL